MGGPDSAPGYEHGSSYPGFYGAPDFGGHLWLSYLVKWPVRLRSMATSLSAFQIKKLGFFRPHCT
jgi:hypothetical protein